MITKDDLMKFKQFKTLVQRTKIEVQGDAVILAASLMQWFFNLESKLEYLEQKLANEKQIAEMKEKQEPIKDEKKVK